MATVSNSSLRLVCSRNVRLLGARVLPNQRRSTKGPRVIVSVKIHKNQKLTDSDHLLST